MKHTVKYILQKILGLENYLFVFSLFTMGKLKYDRKERDFLHFLSLLSDGETLLDIGANIGVMTVHMARRFPASTVCSFEPVPVNLLVLRKMVKLFGLKNVTVYGFALGDHSGEMAMILPEDRSVALHGLSHVKHYSIQEFNKGKEFTVAMKRLDDIQELKSLEIAGIKLDVENFEYFVLSGGKELIDRCKPVIYSELWDNKNRINTFRMLENSGYRIMVREHKKLVPFDRKKHQTQNFFFLPVAD